MSQGQSSIQSSGAAGAIAGRVLPAKWDDHATFTVEEAGEILGLSRGSAYAAAVSGELPTIRFGRRYVVPRVPLERLLAGHQDQRSAA